MTIDELSSFGDPDAGLARLLEVGCASEEEKMFMRVAVLRALCKIQGQEHQELLDLSEESRKRRRQTLPQAEDVGIAALAAEEAKKKPKARKPAAKKSAAKAKTASKKKPAKAKTPAKKKKQPRRKEQGDPFDDLFDELLGDW